MDVSLWLITVAVVGLVGSYFLVGLARDHGVTCLNTPGLVDAGYRGEIQVLLVNTDPDADFAVARGERIAQLVIQRVEMALLVEVAELEGEGRGGGLGHTGR